MSKVTFTLTMDEYICTCLEEIRIMDKTRDYSSLNAVVERIQTHANRMEEALYQHANRKLKIKRILETKKSKAELKKEIKEALDE